MAFGGKLALGLLGLGIVTGISIPLSMSSSFVSSSANDEFTPIGSDHSVNSPKLASETEDGRQKSVNQNEEFVNHSEESQLNLNKEAEVQKMSDVVNSEKQGIVKKLKSLSDDTFNFLNRMKEFDRWSNNFIERIDKDLKSEDFGRFASAFSKIEENFSGSRSFSYIYRDGKYDSSIHKDFQKLKKTMNDIKIEYQKY